LGIKEGIVFVFIDRSEFRIKENTAIRFPLTGRGLVMELDSAALQ